MDNILPEDLLLLVVFGWAAMALAEIIEGSV